MFRRRRFRSRSSRPINKTYKKVLNFAPASRGTATQEFPLVLGLDNNAIGQTTPTDHTVPTGSVISFITVMLSMVNLAATANFVNTALQYTLTGQTPVIANVIGGDPQRNQVIHQDLFSNAQGQNTNRIYKFKIPAKFQRVKEGMIWNFGYKADATHESTIQVIYTVKL